MSYEGYTQVLCKNGHYHQYDAHDDPTSCQMWEDPKEKTPWKCPDCEEGLAWTNMVDQTNCCVSPCTEGLSEEEQKKCKGHGRGYVLLEVEERHDCTCEKCGNKHRSSRVKFKIPECKGHRYP